MKYNYVTFSLLLLLTSGGCEIFNEKEPDFGNCSEELFNLVQEKEFLRVFGEYDMLYKPEFELTEEEIEIQRRKIFEKHELLLNQMEGLNISGVNRMDLSPQIAMSVDREALNFLCKSDLIKDVQKVNRYTTY